VRAADVHVVGLGEGVAEGDCAGDGVGVEGRPWEVLVRGGCLVIRGGGCAGVVDEGRRGVLGWPGLGPKPSRTTRRW
jgi:hypothetical protein